MTGLRVAEPSPERLRERGEPRCEGAQLTLERLTGTDQVVLDEEVRLLVHGDDPQVAIQSDHGVGKRWKSRSMPPGTSSRS